MKAIARLIGISSLIFVLSGCGGGGEDLASRPRVRVHWPALGRSLQASAYANSIRITFPNARLNPATVDGIVQNNVVIEANRLSDAESDVVYSMPEAIKAGKTAMTIETFSQANQQGRQIQTANASVLPDADGFFPDVDLKPGLGAIRSVNLFVETPPGPPEIPRDIPTTFVGNSPQIYLNAAAFNSFQPITDQEIHWDISFSENSDGDVTEGVPFKQSPFFSNLDIKTIHPGVVTLKAVVDGVSSQTVRFRIIKRPG